MCKARTVQCVALAVLVGLCVLVIAAGPNGPATVPQSKPAEAAGQKFEYSDEGQLEQGCADLLRYVDPKGSVTEYDSDGQPAIRYLDHPNPWMSRCAADILMRSELNFSSTTMSGYLDAKYPIHVRMMALYRSLLCQATQAEWRAGFNPRKYRESMNLVWARQFSEIMASPLTPPYFVRLIEAYGNSMEADSQTKKLYELIKLRGDVRLAARRCLAALPAAGSPDQVVSVLVHTMKTREAMEELVAFYPLIEDPQARRAVLSGARYEFGRSADIARQEWYKSERRKLQTLAKSDWDVDIRDDAKALDRDPGTGPGAE